jgi:hypothetical protein
MIKETKVWQSFLHGGISSGGGKSFPLGSCPSAGVNLAPSKRKIRSSFNRSRRSLNASCIDRRKSHRPGSGEQVISSPRAIVIRVVKSGDPLTTSPCHTSLETDQGTPLPLARRARYTEPMAARPPRIWGSLCISHSSIVFYLRRQAVA